MLDAEPIPPLLALARVPRTLLKAHLCESLRFALEDPTLHAKAQHVAAYQHWELLRVAPLLSDEILLRSLDHILCQWNDADGERVSMVIGHLPYPDLQSTLLDAARRVVRSRGSDQERTEYDMHLVLWERRIVAGGDDWPVLQG